MIVTVTLNPALDVTYTVPALVPGTTHRPTVAEQAGGKGINVARTLRSLGREAVAILPLGSTVGEELRLDLLASGIEFVAVPIAGSTRRTVTIVGGEATAFNEPGPAIDAEGWQAIQAVVAAALQDAEVLVLSGSLPPGLPEDAYGVLVGLAREASVPVVLDAEGPVLLRALAARPTVIKPNAHELLATTGLDDPVAAARLLLEAGAEAVVASFGPGGLRAVTAEGEWSARPPAISTGNPTGAGDATVAALAVGLADGTPWPELLADAAALSAATVLTPRAGAFDAEAYERFAREVVVDGSDVESLDIR